MGYASHAPSVIHLHQGTLMTHQNKSLPVALFGLRISVFLVMFMWTIDKFINPAHAGEIYEKFYFIAGLESSVLLIILAVVELVILIAFLAGLYKKFSYGFVLVIHAISTLSSFKQYLSPFEVPHLLFFAAWPMLAACVALFLLRDEDVLLTFHQSLARAEDE
jgi:putative oxidoreductase